MISFHMWITNIKELHALAEYISPRKTWDNRYVYRAYKKSISEAKTINGLHQRRLDLAKGRKRLGEMLYARLVKQCENKRAELLQSGRFYD